MKKTFMLIFTATIVVLLCSGCTSADYSAIDSTDNITIVEMAERNLSEVQAVDVSLVSFDIAKVTDVLFDNRTIVEHSSTQNSCFIQADDQTYLTYFSTPALVKLHYRTEYADAVFNTIHLEQNTIENVFDLPLANSNFDFASREQVEAEILQLLQRLGITNIGDTKIYSLSQKDLASLSISQSNGKEILESTNDFFDSYLVQIKCIIHDIPLCEVDSALPNSETLFGSKINALFTKDGIEGLEITNLYVPHEVEGLYSVISAQDAATVVYKKLSSIITRNSYVITDADLRYAQEFKDKSHSSLRLIPVWLICVEETNIDYAINNKFYILVNALTGNEFF